MDFSTKYNDQRWKDKRYQILLRDNFTCQNENCRTFNPSLGDVTIIDEKDPVHYYIHNYNNKFESKYFISSSRTGISLTIQLDFGIWIVMPILQVHHLAYIEGRDPWDYSDEILITLCKECHTLLHKSFSIRKYYNNGNFTEEKYLVRDEGSGHNHNFRPWTLISKDGLEYNAEKQIRPHFQTVLFKDGINSNKKLEESVRIVEHFFQKYLNAYKIEL